DTLIDTGQGQSAFLAGPGDDTIRAGATHGDIFAGPGGDTISVAYDGTSDSKDTIELLSCGPGFDTVQASGMSDPSLRTEAKAALLTPPTHREPATFRWGPPPRSVRRSAGRPRPPPRPRLPQLVRPVQEGPPTTATSWYRAASRLSLVLRSAVVDWNTLAAV